MWGLSRFGPSLFLNRDPSGIFRSQRQRDEQRKHSNFPSEAQTIKTIYPYLATKHCIERWLSIQARKVTSNAKVILFFAIISAIDARDCNHDNFQATNQRSPTFDILKSFINLLAISGICPAP